MMASNRTFDIAYLGVFPVAHKSEGLNVLLCDTIKPLIADGVKVRIHTTNRHAEKVAQALDGNGVALGKVDIQVYQVGALMLTFLKWYADRRKQTGGGPSLWSRWFGGLIAGGSSFLKKFVLWLSDLTAYNLLPKLLVGGVVLGGGFLLSLPFLLLGGLGAAILLLAKKLLPRLKRVIRQLARRVPVLRRAFGGRSSFMSRLISSLIYSLYDQEQRRFAAAVGRKVDTMFFFNAFDGMAVEAFAGKKLVVFPDAVTSMFPLRYADAHVEPLMAAMQRSIIHSDALVCYSKYVRDYQLKKLFAKDVEGKRIEVIPQGYFFNDTHADISRRVAQAMLYEQRHRLVNLFPELLKSPPHANFGHFDYILYPTIDRPHKNTVTLVRAFADLLRRRHRNVKLLLTTPHVTEDVKELIMTERLQYDVLYMPSVPIDVLDLLFKGAALMVHPSLAEGGDIFNFSRAASVGCPSLMADIPVVREMFERAAMDRDVYAEWLFDPVNYGVLADKMDAVLSAPEGFLKPQKAVLQELSSYGFREMAYRYLDCYESI